MSSLRVFFIILAVLIMVGIALSGWNVHWFLYVVPGVLTLAAAIGFCPGLFFLKLIGFKGQGGRLK